MSKLKIAALLSALMVSQTALAGSAFGTSGGTANNDLMVNFELVQTKIQPVCTITQSPVFGFGTINATSKITKVQSKLVISCDAAKVPLKITFDDSLSGNAHTTAQGESVSGGAPLWTFSAALSHANMPTGGVAYNQTGNTLSTYFDQSQVGAGGAEGYTIGGKVGGVKYLKFTTTSKVTTINMVGALSTSVPTNIKTDVTKTLTLPITLEVTA